MREVHVVMIQDGPMQALGSKSSKDPSSLKCDQCSKTFSRSWLLKNHLRVHTGERPYRCSFCEKAFADKSNLRQHQKIHTTTEKLFQCGICQRTFAQRRYLMKHATEIHRDVSMSMYGSQHPEPKAEEPVKMAAERQTTKTSGSVVQTTPEIPNKSADHQYLTRQKSRTKTVSESKEEKETSEKKYSEQDLKDFIKSNQKTMEKNGYIFIKQNFESLDTEPTLTEMSEVPVTAIKDEVALKTDNETGNQILNVNGKMVYLQMENKLIATQALSQNSQVSTQSYSEPSTQTGTSCFVKGRKLVAKKDSGVRRQANILKSSTKKVHENIVSGNAVKFVNVANMKQTLPKPMHLIPAVQQPMSAEPLTLVQVLQQGGTFPMVSQGQYMVPVSVVQMPHHGQQLLVAANSSNLKPISLPSINSVSMSSEVRRNIHNTVGVISDTNQQVIEVQTTPVSIDEKGAASDMSGSHGIINPTPIVSDAPWQGIVNINSEQELYEYINSQSVSTVENDQGMTILIQNVDSQNGSVMSLDSQNLLSGSGNFSNVFHEQSAIISDVLPDSVDITEVQINSDEPACQNSNQNEEDTSNEVNHETFTEEIVQEEEPNLVIIKEEASNDSDDAQSQVMLTEANREHLSDQEDFTDDQNEKMLIKGENDLETEPFSDHSMYTAPEVKCDIDERPEQLMDTADCESEEMVIDDNTSANDNIEPENAELKDAA